MEWRDPYEDEGPRGGSGVKGYAAVALMLVAVLGLGALSYSVLGTAHNPPEPSTSRTGSSPAGNGTTAAPPQFASLPPATVANGTTLSCQWAASGQRIIQCLAGSQNARAVTVGLAIYNPAHTAVLISLNYTLNEAASWNASCALDSGSLPRQVAPGGPLPLAPGTSLVACVLTPRAPGSTTFYAVLGR